MYVAFFFILTPDHPFQFLLYFFPPWTECSALTGADRLSAITTTSSAAADVVVVIQKFPVDDFFMIAPRPVVAVETRVARFFLVHDTKTGNTYQTNTKCTK
jgi:hypothetical protein